MKYIQKGLYRILETSNYGVNNIKSLDYVFLQ